MDEATTRRYALVWHLVYRGVIHDPAVRTAMLAVPRHLFLPGETRARAYEDDAIPTKRTAEGIAISSASQPAMVAAMLEQLALAPGLRVLEIGAGTGYNAALLRTLVGDTGHVTTIDIDADTAAAARMHLNNAGITDVTIITADGVAGYTPNVPYDRIILTAGAADIAPAWIAQLVPEGILVLPLRIGAAQFSIAFRLQSNGWLAAQSVVPCGFMPLRGEMNGDEQHRAISEEMQIMINHALTTPEGISSPAPGVTRITAIPSGDMTPAPHGALVVILPHWRLVIAYP